MCVLILDKQLLDDLDESHSLEGLASSYGSQVIQQLHFEHLLCTKHCLR